MPDKLSLKIACLGLGAFLNVYGLLWWAASSQREFLPDFSQRETVAERKAAFTDFLTPRIHEVQSEILSERKALLDLEQALEATGQLDARQWAELRELSDKYLRNPELDPEEPEEWIRLLHPRIDIIPIDLTLAQAALESGWGSSHFARKGNNLFGMRCFRPGCGMRPRWSVTQLPYGYSRYSSPSESIAAYMLNLNRHDAYSDLRQHRARQRSQGGWPDSHALSNQLDNYAENPNYIRAIQRMFTDNPEWHALTNQEL